MHLAALAASGLKGAYLPFSPPPERLGQAVAALLELGFDGLNVTVPHKRAVASHLSSLSPEAAAVGAVNTLVREGGGYRGHNTDCSGFAESCLAAPLTDGPVVLLGAGGAARAVARALSLKGLPAVVAARDLEKAERLAADFGLEAAPWADLPGLGPWALAVNATSASSPEELGPAAPVLRLGKGTLMADLNYGRADNHFKALADQAGARFQDGLAMLAAQARASFRLWTGSDPGPAPFRLAATSEAAASFGPAR
jgi:shikimate dehydrogenase